jgi:hypothetical protein
MIKIFRAVRQKLLNENPPPEATGRVGTFNKYLIYAFGEIVLVVLGILIALQINNWNEIRKEHIEAQKILVDLQADIRTDIETLNDQVDFKKKMIRGYKNCLDMLAGKKKEDKSEFMESFKSILQVGDVTLNATTFSNLKTTGKIRLIEPETLADSIVDYYNTDLGAWQSALREYTRTITAPYILNFDYIPQNIYQDSLGSVVMMVGEPKDFQKAEKTLSDYKQDYFIINTLRQKTWNLEVLMIRYSNLLDYAHSLDEAIQNYLKKQ